MDNQENAPNQTRAAQIVMFGSRGDHEPLISLAVSMLETGKFSHIHICALEEYMHLIPKHPRISTHKLSFNMGKMWPVFYFELFKTMLYGWFRGNSDSISLQRECFTSMTSRTAIPIGMDLIKLSLDPKPDLLIGSVSLIPILLCMARSLRIPFWLFHFQPNTPTHDFPFYLSTMKNVLIASKQVALMQSDRASHKPSSEYLDSYELAMTVHGNVIENMTEMFEIAGIPSFTLDDVKSAFAGTLNGVHVVNAYPRQVVPRCPEWPETIYQVPALAADYIPPGWRAEEKCPRLFEYLSTSDEKPFCISFGSMNLQNKGAVTRALFSALREAGLTRVLMIQGGANLGVHQLSWFDRELKEWATEHIFVSKEAPQNAWLLPKCSALMCHGGAGTMCAGLRAGIPLVISPHLSDQFFWAHLCKEIGVGAVAGPSVQEATQNSFQDAINATFSHDMRRRAEEIGVHIRSDGCGSTMTAEIIANSKYSI